MKETSRPEVMLPAMTQPPPTPHIKSEPQVITKLTAEGKAFVIRAEAVSTLHHSSL